MSQNRRRFVRKAIEVEFRGSSKEGLGQLIFDGVDLSPGGTFLRSHLLLEQGEELSLEFHLPGQSKVVQAPGRVAWVRRFPKADEPAGMGIEFTAIGDQDRDLLSRHLSSLGGKV
jgi:uncharacterized protein (TIGR02266 family)